MHNYLIETDSKVLLDEKLKEIIKNKENVITYSYPENSILEVLEEASYVSMFLDMKYIVYKNADFFGKSKLNEKEMLALENYFKQPYDLTTIIFTTYNSLDKKNTLLKLFNKESIIELKSPKGYELVNKTKNLFTKNGFLLDDKSIKYVIDSSLNSWDLINNELAKFKLYFMDEDNVRVSKKDVFEITSNNLSDNQFKFVDAVITFNSKEAFKILDELVTLKVEVLGLINLLLREYKLMYYYLILERKKESTKDILKKIHLVEWQLQKVQRNVINYDMSFLEEIIVKLAYIDLDVKSGKIDKLDALKMFLVDIFE